MRSIIIDFLDELLQYDVQDSRVLGRKLRKQLAKQKTLKAGSPEWLECYLEIKRIRKEIKRCMYR